MEHKVQIACVGHITLDDIVLHTGETRMHCFGGAAIYSASGVAYWRRDKDVGIITRRGLDFTDEMLQPIADHPAMDVSDFIPLDRDGIGLWLIYDSDGYRHWITKHTSISLEDATPRPQDMPMHMLETAQGFHFAPVPLPQVLPLVQAVPKGRIIQLDPHYDWFYPQHEEEWNKVLAYVDILMPSEDELTKFFAIPLQEDPLAYKPYMISLAQRGPKIVVVKLGEKGALMYLKEENIFYLIPPYGGDVVDVTGAGDSFCGSFLSDYIQHKDPYRAALCGMVGSSITLEHMTSVNNYKVPYGEAHRRLELFAQKMGPAEKWVV